MKKKFYKELYLLEERHWWHIAKREISVKLLKKFIKNKSIRILDVGCGTGKNVEIFSNFGKAWGIDKSKEAINYCKKRRIKNIKLGKAEQTGFKKNFFDVVTMLDVLEHVNDKKTLNEIHRILKPNGILLVSVPAYQKLWSKWDVVLHHKRRYSKNSLENLFKNNNFNVKKISYMFSFLFLPTFILRKLKSAVYNENYPSDFKLAPPLVNLIMLTLSRIEQKMIVKNNVSFGTSIICVVKKHAEK